MRNSKLALGLAGAAAVGALALGGAALANAETNPTPSASGTATSGSPIQGAPGGGQSPDTAVTGAERTKVEAAVKAKDSGITVEEVRMDPDGSYDVLGTSGGQQVFYDVSKDLATITLNQGPGGPQGGRHGGAPGSSSGGTAGSSSGSSSSSTAATG